MITIIRSHIQWGEINIRTLEKSYFNVCKYTNLTGKVIYIMYRGALYSKIASIEIKSQCNKN